MNNQNIPTMAKTFSRFLKENRAYYPYKRAVYLSNKNIKNWDSLFRYANGFHLLTSNTFIWHRTREGYDFWRRLDDIWRKIADHYHSQK